MSCPPSPVSSNNRIRFHPIILSVTEDILRQAFPDIELRELTFTRNKGVATALVDVPDAIIGRVTEINGVNVTVRPDTRKPTRPKGSPTPQKKSPELPPGANLNTKP